MTINKMKRQFQARLTYVMVLTVLVLGLCQTVLWAKSPVRPQPGLPVRPPTPTLPNPAQGSKQEGAYILLRINTWQEDWSTIVQWQGTDGIWHDTDGWRGRFSQQGYVKWWVDPHDLNKGPFRWVLYSAKNNDVLWVSTAFKLPVSGAVLEMTVDLEGIPH